MFWIRALFFNVIDGTGEFPSTYLLICKFENEGGFQAKFKSSPSR